MPNLNKVFAPASVAVVGASNKEGSVGQSLIANIVRSFPGAIYTINQKSPEIAGLKAYPSLSAVGAPIDLMVIAVPAAAVPTVLEEGGRLGIGGAVVISAGFKEIGNDALEEELKEISARYDIALIGPNCLGIISPYANLNASFAATDADCGQVAFVSQSGAVCTAILDSARSLGIGFSKFMSVGNKAVIDEAEIFDYLAADDKTKIIALYAEQLSEPEKLIARVRSLGVGTVKKPVIVLKSGRSVAGASASASHTGALAGNDAAYGALFRQAGMIRAERLEELFDYIKIFDNNRLGAAKRLAIITNAGGPGVVAIDAAAAEGLEIASLTPETTAALAAVLPPAANLHNPIDVLGDARADRYQAAIEAVIADPNVDSILVILTPQSTTEVAATAEAIIAAKKKCPKPLAVAFIGGDLIEPGLELFKPADIAAYNFPEEAVRSLRILDDFFCCSFGEIASVPEFPEINREEAAAILAAAKKEGKKQLAEAEARPVFAAYGFPLLESIVAHSREEAAAIAAKIGRPLAFKIDSPDILHKSDAGGILLNVNPEEAAEKFDELWRRVSARQPQAHLNGVLISEMITGGVEMIIGSAPDPALGNMIMLGLGGIYVEVFKDVAFGLNPLSAVDVRQMISSLKTKKLLTGVRGAAAADEEALVREVLRLALFLKDFPEIAEIDLNPVMVLPLGQGVRILDARIVLKS